VHVRDGGVRVQKPANPSRPTASRYLIVIMLVVATVFVEVLAVGILFSQPATKM
jgi:hypothetical protein